MDLQDYDAYATCEEHNETREEAERRIVIEDQRWQEFQMFECQRLAQEDVRRENL